MQRLVGRRLLEGEQRRARGVGDQPRRPREAPAVGHDARAGHEAAGDPRDEHATGVAAHVAARVAPGERRAGAVARDVEVDGRDRGRLISRARVKRPMRSAAACSSVSPPDGRARQATAPRPSGPSAACGRRGLRARTGDAHRLAERPAGLRPRGPDDVAAAAPAGPVEPGDEDAALAADGDRRVTPAGRSRRPRCRARTCPPAGRRETTIGVSGTLLVDRAPDDRGVAAPADAERDVTGDVGAQIGDRQRRGERAARRPDAHLDGVDVGRRAAGRGRRGEAHPGDDGAALGVDAEVRGADRVRVQRRGRGCWAHAASTPATAISANASRHAREARMDHRNLRECRGCGQLGQAFLPGGAGGVAEQRSRDDEALDL